MSTLLDELTALRLATLQRHAAFRVESAQAQAQVQAALRTALTHLEDGRGELLVRRDAASGHLIAAVGLYEVARGWHGHRAQLGVVEHVPGDPAAIAFVCEALRELCPQFDPQHLELSISAAYPEVRRCLLELGVGIDSVDLLGEPRRALARLVARYDPPRSLEHLGLRIERLRDPALAAETVALQLDFFRRHPEYCWFYAYPGFAERQAESLAEQLDSNLHYVIRTTRGELGGSFCASLEPDNALWGYTAGMDLMLCEALHGQGIAKTIYRILLEGLVERGVEVFKGGTAQPAVLGLARLMKRPLLNILMRLGTRFAPSHFAAVL